MRALSWIALYLVLAWPAHGQNTTTLAGAYAAAWARSPAAQAAGERDLAVAARQRAASALTPEAPALEVGGRSDRFNRDRGAAEIDLGLAVPLWLPGERSGSQALAGAEGEALAGRLAALRLQLAGEVRQAWWAWQLARNDHDLAGDRVAAAQRLRDDVARRVAAGDLARSDQHQAEGLLASARAQQAEAEAGLTAARLALEVLTGQPAGTGGDGQEAAVVERDSAALLAAHPRLRDASARGEVARSSLELARARSRANPEITLSTRRERSVAGTDMEQTWAIGLRIPLAAGPRHDARLAEANADLIEAGVLAERERERLAQEAQAAHSRWLAARAQLLASEERARLARENRGFFDKSFRLGESDLPTRLRIEQEAFEAERQAGRARINLAASLSAYRQALGLLPE